MMQRHTPMGYQMKDGKMGFDEERAKIVKRFFRLSIRDLNPCYS